MPIQWGWDDPFEPADEFIRSQQRVITPPEILTPNCRGILFSWLFDVANTYDLRIDSLLLAARMIDQITFVTKNILQLVAAACLMIAVKYEEVKIPYAEDYVWICNDAFDGDALVAMELRVLQHLNYKIRTPTTLCFLSPCDDLATVEYLTYVAVLDASLSALLPVVVGETIMDVANRELPRHPDCFSMFKTALAQVRNKDKRPGHDHVTRIFTERTLGVWFERLRCCSV